MKTDFPFTVIHQLLLLVFFFFRFRCLDLSNLFIYFPYARGPKNQDFTVFLFFSNKAGVDAAECLESAEEEANKRTVLDRRTYSKPSGRRTGQKHGRNGGKGKNGGDNNGSHDRKKGKGSNPPCPESEGTCSKCPSPRSQPTDPC